MRQRNQTNILERLRIFIQLYYRAKVYWHLEGIAPDD